MDNTIVADRTDTEKRQAVLEALSSDPTHYMVICEKTGLGAIEVRHFLNALIDEGLATQLGDGYGLIEQGDLEKTELEILEEQIRKDFYQRGKALKEIREGQLYKKAYKEFRDYLDERWGWSQSYASRFIQATEVLDNLTIKYKVLPTNESQCRPMFGLNLDQQYDVWDEALKMSKGITPKTSIVQEALEECKRRWNTNPNPFSPGDLAKIITSAGDCKGKKGNWCFVEKTDGSQVIARDYEGRIFGHQLDFELVTCEQELKASLRETMEAMAELEEKFGEVDIVKVNLLFLAKHANVFPSMSPCAHHIFNALIDYIALNASTEVKGPDEFCEPDEDDIDTIIDSFSDNQAA